MPRWNCRCFRELPRLLVMVMLVLGGVCATARAEFIASGIFSPRTEVEAAEPLDPATAPPVNPFPGIRPPDTQSASILAPPADPVVANVEGHPIYLSELGEAVKTLPEALRKMPFEVIYPVLLDRMVDHEALVLLALRRKLDEDPAVKRQIDAATARVLEGALLERTAVPEVTEAAIRARYNQEFGGRPTVEEVHARHILVRTEAEAKRLIADLDKGADFAALARRFSRDPDSARGGDLGFFRRDQVWPAFAELAFSLKPGEIGQTPISNEFGWHVVQVLGRRSVSPPSFDQVRDAISKQLLQEAVRQVVAKAREGLIVHRFNLDGTAMGGGSDNNGGGPLAGNASPSSAQAPNTANPVGAPQNTGN